ncbi:MAG: hypothetical protein AAF840_15360 [Bacteroidota bacterium]
MFRKIWENLRKIDTNRSVAISAVFISLCALYVSVQEMRLMRVQQRVSVYPHLTLWRNYSSEGFGVYIKNSGTGLASINSMQLTDGERFFNNWLDVVDHYLPDSLAFGYDRMLMDNLNGEIVTPGEERRLLFLRWTPTIRKFEEDTRHLTMRVCYSSLLNQSWLLENKERTALDHPCPRIEEQEFY